MDYAKIKTEAKERIQGHLWDIWKPALVIAVISAIFSLLINGLFDEGSFAASIASMLLNFLLLPAEFGYVAYVLKFVRGEKYELEDLKLYYPKFGVLLVMNIIVSIFVLLGFICLIVPGVILALSYAMISYIFVDNPDLEATEYLTRSKEMMLGYKTDYFMFCLSFLGWIILCVLVIPAIWVVPYMTVATTLYYEELRKKNGDVKTEEPKKVVVEEVKEETKEEVKKEAPKKTATKKPAAKKTTTKKVDKK